MATTGTQDCTMKLGDELSGYFRRFDIGSRLWSAVFNWSLALSATMSAGAALVLKIKMLQTGLGLSDDSLKDIAAIAAAGSTLVTSLAAGGGFGRKWQANRVSRGRVERLQIQLSSPTVDCEKIREELCDLLEKHDQAIIGAPVK